MNWFTNLRLLAEVKKIRLALERIATCQEEQLLQGRDRTTGTGIRSLYKGDADGSVLVQDDAEFAELERQEKERAAQGGAEEDLEGEWR